MKPTVYLETTIPSYLASRPSRDLITAAHQQITHTWWLDHRQKFEMFISQTVLDEASAGDRGVAQRRLALLDGLAHLDVSDECLALGQTLVGRGRIPRSAAADALHVAVATVHRMDYLLTWNCAHIANARLRPMIQYACKEFGCQAPVICTPEQLLEP